MRPFPVAAYHVATIEPGEAITLNGKIVQQWDRPRGYVRVEDDSRSYLYRVSATYGRRRIREALEAAFCSRYMDCRRLAGSWPSYTVKIPL